VAIKNGESRETGNIVQTKRRLAKQKHNTICVGHHYAQTNTNNVNKTWALLQTTGGKDEPSISLCGKRYGLHNTELRRHIKWQHKKLKNEDHRPHQINRVKTLWIKGDTNLLIELYGWYKTT
jgi:hypothetical protein